MRRNACSGDPARYGGGVMKSFLRFSYQVVYYDKTGRQVYWPADIRSGVLSEKLREARERGLNARLSQTEAVMIAERKAA